MMQTQRRLVRPCPLCGVAMQMSTAREGGADIDVFRCLACRTTVSEPRPARPDDGKRDG